MARRLLALGLVGACTLLLSCTNDYEDFAYVPEESDATTGGGPGSECTDNDDCGEGEDCVGGECSCGGGPGCGPGEGCCAFQGCIDLDDDPDNCGDCGNECPMFMDCNDGMCVP